MSSSVEHVAAGDDGELLSFSNFVETITLFPALTAEQLSHVCGALEKQRTISYSPRKLLPISFLDPGFDPEKDAGERVDRLWDDALLVRKEKIPDMVVYGIVNEDPSFDDSTFWLCKVLNPLTGIFEVHYFFKKQGLSNFIGWGGGLTLKLTEATVMTLPTIEHAFQFTKALTVKTEQGCKAAVEVMLSEKPLGAKRATGRGKLDMPKDDSSWDRKSARVMKHLVASNLTNRSFYDMLSKLLRLSTVVLGVSGRRVFVHEGSEDDVYGIKLLPGAENPLKNLKTYNADGTHNWDGGDVLGKALTQAMILVRLSSMDHEKYMQSTLKPGPIFFTGGGC